MSVECISGSLPRNAPNFTCSHLDFKNKPEGSEGAIPPPAFMMEREGKVRGGV